MLLMPTNHRRSDAQNNWIQRRKILRRTKASSDIFTILFHIAWHLMRWRIISTYLHLTSDNNDISPLAIAIKIEGNPGVLLDMRKTFGLCPAIDEERCGSFIP